MAAQDVVQSVREQPSLVASLFVYGALLEVAAREVKSLPAQRASTPQSPHRTSADLLGAHAEGVPDLKSYLLRIPWIARRGKCQLPRLLPY